MKESQKTKEQLVEELAQIRRELATAASSKKKPVKNNPEPSKSDNIFYKAFLSSPDMFIIANPVNGTYLEVNESFVENTGYSREELIGRSVVDINLWANQEEFDKMNRLLAEFGKLTDEEFSFRMKSGKIRLWLCSAEIVNMNGTDRMLAVATDITERKRAEERQRSILEAALDGFWINDSEGKFLEVNDSYCMMIGYTREELLGMSVMDVDAIDNQEDILERIDKTTKQGFNRFETQHKRKDGRIINVEISTNIIDVEGRQISVFVRDITERKQAEEALKESEEKYRAVIENANIGIIVVQDNRLVFCNPWIYEMLDYTEDELYKNDVMSFVHPDDKLVIGELMKDFLIGKPGTHTIEMRVLSKSGEIMWITGSSVLIQWQGKPAIQSFIIDITERKRAEQALKINEERFRLIADNATDLISRIQIIPTIKTDYVSPSCLRITGYKQEEFYQDPNLGLEMIHPEDREFFLKHTNSNNKKNQKPITIRLVRKDGQVIWIEQTHAAISNDKGETVAMHLIARDITERKRAEEALRESEAQLQGIIRAAPIGIALVQDRVALWVNDYYCTMTGYSAQELVGLNARKLCTSDEEFLRVGKLEAENIKLHGKSEIESKLVCKNGNIIDLLIISTPLNPEDPYAGEIAMMMDITERKKAEEQEREAKNLRELDILRTELLANVSHELRTPLASIKGFTTVLTDYDKKLTTEEKREYLEIIDHNTDRLSELIEQLLVMSRLGTGMLTIDKSPSDINKLCREVISEAKIRSPEYQFILDLPAKLPRVHIDTRRIRQVLDNLIDNAVKHSSAGSEISVATRKSNGEIVVTVTDEKTGISRKDKPYIFNRMFHAERNHQPRVTGAGLGLSICKGLIEEHKGKIWIESEEGKGTRCFFTLPTYNNRGVSHGKKDKGQYHSVRRG